jgi:uncharacterized membrane protein YfhO
MVEILKTINSVIAFLLELVMLAAFSYWGFHGEKSVLMKWLLGIGAPVAVAFILGLYLAPNAAHRLNITAGTILSLVLLLGAAIALYQTGHSVLAITLAIIVIINQAFLLLWKQW